MSEISRVLACRLALPWLLIGAGILAGVALQRVRRWLRR